MKRCQLNNRCFFFFFFFFLHSYRNIYGEHSYPPLDGTNLWPILSQPSKYPAVDAAHPNGLVLTKEVLISGQYKLLVSQPSFKTQNNGWRQPDGQWVQPLPNQTIQCMKQDAPPSTGSVLSQDDFWRKHRDPRKFVDVLFAWYRQTQWVSIPRSRRGWCITLPF